MTHFQFFEVGGCVRDSFLGINSKDVDFSVVSEDGRFADITEAFASLSAHLDDEGFKIFESKPEFQTIRAQVPKDHVLRSRTTVADFVLARKDGPYSDGRRPDWVAPGTLMDDLARRDFRCNAMAVDIEGNLIDPFGGMDDLQNRILRFVGRAQDRIAEDGLRVMRGFRFSITKNFGIADEDLDALKSELAAEMLAAVSVERVQKELMKMFASDTLGTLNLLAGLPSKTREAIFRDGLKLKPTLEKM